MCKKYYYQKDSVFAQSLAHRENNYVLSANPTEIYFAFHLFESINSVLLEHYAQCKPSPNIADLVPIPESNLLLLKGQYLMDWSIVSASYYIFRLFSFLISPSLTSVSLFCR